MTSPTTPATAATAAGPGRGRSARAHLLWRLLEPVHAVVYFAPDARERFDAVGLRGFWMGYFASRSAALGTPGPELVTATFYVFHPPMVARALPDAWSRATPDAVLGARLGLAESVLRRALGETAAGAEVVTAAELATRAARSAPTAGRPLAAAHAALPLPDDPLLRLWWAATVLREHRGDGHVAALVSAGVDPCEALVLAAAGGAAGPDGAALLQTSRQWPDERWSAATRQLAGRGWLHDGGELTPAGAAARAEIEAVTDRAAATAYAGLDDGQLDQLVAALGPLARRLTASGAVAFPNPIGLPPSAD